METSDNHEHPRCPIDGAALICPSCRARAIGAKGGAARSKRKAAAAKKAARRPETKARRSAAQLARWERHRAATGAAPPAPRAPRAPAPPPAETNEHSGSGQHTAVESRPAPDILVPAKSGLAAALAKRRG